MKAVAAGAILALVLAACAGSDERPAGGALEWESCGAPFECATLAVPLDYERPEAQTLELALVRLPATDAERRIGALVVNPGGPGESGVEFLRVAATLLFAEELRTRFDLVGFDPRGIGESSPISCGPNREALVAADPVPDDEAERDAVEALVRGFVDACRRDEGRLLPYLGTVNAARDLDRIRAALGDGKLTYMGLSYGTRLGSVYAHLFPGRVRALVLDGGVHPSASAERFSRDGAEALEDALGRFFADCRARQDCFAGPDPEATWDEAQELAERGKPGLFYLGARLLLIEGTPGWDILARGLAAAAKGNDTLLQATARLAFPDGSNELEAGFAVSCADDPGREAFGAYELRTRELERDFPRLGFTASAACFEGWPAPAEPLPRVRAAGAPPILVVGTTHDPATPRAWSVALADALESGVLLT